LLIGLGRTRSDDPDHKPIVGAIEGTAIRDISAIDAAPRQANLEIYKTANIAFAMWRSSTLRRKAATRLLENSMAQRVLTLSTGSQREFYYSVDAQFSLPHRTRVKPREER
jgi:hypothetical protein